MNKIFAAHLDNLYEMLLFIRSQAESIGFDEIEISKIELACEEALVNIISYGYPTMTGEIQVHCTPHKKRDLKSLSPITVSLLTRFPMPKNLMKTLP